MNTTHVLNHVDMVWDTRLTVETEDEIDDTRNLINHSG
jgi:hypothetical protein